MLWWQGDGNIVSDLDHKYCKYVNMSMLGYCAMCDLKVAEPVRKHSRSMILESVAWSKATLMFLSCNAIDQNDIARFVLSFHEYYSKVSNIIRTKSQHLKDSRTVLRLSLPNLLKPDVKTWMKM